MGAAARRCAQPRPNSLCHTRPCCVWPAHCGGGQRHRSVPGRVEAESRAVGALVRREGLDGIDTASALRKEPREPAEIRAHVEKSPAGRQRVPPEDLLRRAYVPVAQLGHGPRDDVGARQDSHPEASGRGGCHGQAEAGAGSARESWALCGGGGRLSRVGLPDGVLPVLAAHGALVARVRNGSTTLPLRPALAARHLGLWRNQNRGGNTVREAAPRPAPLPGPRPAPPRPTTDRPAAPVQACRRRRSKRRPGVGCSLAPSSAAPSPGRLTAHGALGCSPPPPRVPRRHACPCLDALCASRALVSGTDGAATAVAAPPPRRARCRRRRRRRLLAPAAQSLSAPRDCGT
mmetsp:Transcript_13124/g.41883  ORF Transcript_13124/g.41883 Transcript_13124/m.41883 type:complete len:347 (-) Transcript_13124:93-1133(-)